MRELLNHFINGAWVASDGGQRHAVINPATEAPCTVITLGTAADVDRAVEAARGRRVDEVVTADPLAPPVARQCAVYRAGVARMTRAYEAEAARWK